MGRRGVLLLFDETFYKCQLTQLIDGAVQEASVLAHFLPPESAEGAEVLDCSRMFVFCSKFYQILPRNPFFIP